MKPKTEKNCKFCGKPFKPYRTTDKYCSMDCALAGGLYKNARKGQYYGNRRKEPNKRLKAKAAARVRDKGKCRLRGIVFHKKHHIGREEHHILYLSEGGPDEDWNLITLCTHCHHEIVHKDKDRWQKRLFVILHGMDWFSKIPTSGLSQANIKKLTYLNTK